MSNKSKIDIENTLYKTIGGKIQKQRVKLDLTQEELAKKATMNRTSITNIENGIQKAPLHVLYQLASILNLSIFDLLPESLDGSY